MENPVPGVIWYADGKLHLDHVVLEVEGIRDMTRVGAGVVYGDDQGRVVFAGDDGSRELLGHKDPAVPVAATDETGLAAWFDPRTDAVHVVEAQTGKVRVEAPVDDDPEVVAVDGDVVYLVGDDGARALLPPASRRTPGQPGPPPRRAVPDPRLPEGPRHDPGRPVGVQHRLRAPRPRRRARPGRQHGRDPGRQRGSAALRHPQRRPAGRPAGRRAGGAGRGPGDDGR